MTIAEVHQKKSELQEAIQSLVAEFEKQTGTTAVISQQITRSSAPAFFRSPVENKILIRVEL